PHTAIYTLSLHDALPIYESHLEEHAGRANRRLHRRDLVERERRRLLAERRLPAGGGGGDDLAMRVRRRHDHDGIDGGIVDERLRDRKSTRLNSSHDQISY